MELRASPVHTYQRTMNKRDLWREGEGEGSSNLLPKAVTACLTNRHPVSMHHITKLYCRLRAHLPSRTSGRLHFLAPRYRTVCFKTFVCSFSGYFPGSKMIVKLFP
jgi:hypothetical protein